MNFIPLERLSNVLHQVTGQFYEVWTPFLEPHFPFTLLQCVLLSFDVFVYKSELDCCCLGGKCVFLWFLVKFVF